jgi:hypothetical protein
VSQPLSDQEKVRCLPWFYAHSAANSAFSVLTWFGPVFVLFLSEIGLPKTRIGVLLSFLPFSGVVALLIAPAVARAGLRRVFLVCWSIRKAVTALLLLTPFVVDRWGAEGAFLFVGSLIAAFAALRAVAETAWYPWGQELVPSAIRGRFQAIVNVVTLISSTLALTAASQVLDASTGLQRFSWLIGGGVVMGILCVLFAVALPGGAPDRERRAAHLPALRAALADPCLRLYLAYAALTLVTMQSVFTAFVPLFMKEQVGLPGSRVVLLEVAAYVCGVLSSYLWGTWTDRRGARPLVPVLGLMALLPLLWMAMPRQEDLSFPLALAISGLAGIATTGWWVADQRLLYVQIVPPAKRTEYMAVYYAWIGLVGGCGPLIAGPLLDHFQHLRGTWGPLTVDAYTPLFAGSHALLACALGLLTALRRRLAADEIAASTAGAHPAKGTP